MGNCHKVSYLFFFFACESYWLAFWEKNFEFFSHKSLLERLYRQEGETTVKFSILKHFVVFNARCQVSLLTSFKFSVVSLLVHNIFVFCLNRRLRDQARYWSCFFSNLIVWQRRMTIFSLRDRRAWVNAAPDGLKKCFGFVFARCL